MSQARDEAGNIWEVDAQGNPIALVQAAGASQPKGAVYSPPADPYKQAAEARAQQDQALQIQKFQLDQQKAQQEAVKPSATEQQLNADRNSRVGSLNTLVEQINRTQELGNQGPMASQGPLSAIGDYLPFAENKRFDTAGAQLSQQGLAAFRVPGTGTVSDRDAMMFDRGNLPQASNMDASNEEILGGLRRRVEGEYKSLGLPAPQWVSPLNQAQPDAPASQAAGGSVANALTGNTRTRYQRSPEVEKQVAAAFRQGASYEQLSAISESAGFGPLNPAEYARAEEARRKGQGGGVTFTIGKNVPLSRMEELSGSETGALLGGIGNAGSFGAVQGLLPDQYRDIQNLHSNYNLGGEVLGSIAGTTALGKLGTGIAGRLGGLGQKMLGGGRAAGLARGVGTDAVYSGIYGANTGQGGAESALQGAIASLGGRGVGKVAGKTLGGFTKAIGADELAQRGVPLTVGQNLGGMAKGFEDRLTGVPMIGDMVNARRTEGFQGFQRALQNEAGSPIGAKFDGGDWRDGLPDQFGQAYDNATAGVNVPLDAQFMPDLQQVAQQARNLPPDLGQRFTSAMDNRMQPIAQAGELTGETYQQGMRGLSGYKAEMTKPGFEQDYRDALSGAQDVLKSQMMRGGGDQVVQGLGKADQSYRMAKVIQDAQNRAAGGSLSGVPGLPAPSQFLAASTANAKKFKGNRPFGELLDAAQQVMPSKIGDSGTSGRIAQLALPAMFVGGTGTGYAVDGGGGAATGAAPSLAIAALLAAGGTKGGQKVLNKALFGRTKALKALGSQIDKRKGLLGAASIPLMLESNK
jgi:hypothetical protein